LTCKALISAEVYPDAILKAYMGIEEKAVTSPWERLGAPIQMVVPRYLGQMATMFFLEVLRMLCMFCLNIAYPGDDGDGWGQR
jgi:hypothetical protein